RGCNDTTDDFAEIHTSVLRNLIHNADDSRIHRRILAARCHARRASLDNENLLSKPGIHRIDGDEIALLVLSIGIDRPADKKLLTFKPRILPGCNNSPDDASQKHG